jgi:hypothetical protein
MLDAVKELLEEGVSSSAALAVGVDEQIAQPKNPRPVARADLQGATEAQGLACIVDSDQNVGMIAKVLEVGPARQVWPGNRLIGELEEPRQRRQVLGDDWTDPEPATCRHGWMLAPATNSGGQPLPPSPRARRIIRP